MKCEALTCKYNKLENYLYGYCKNKNARIQDNTKCWSFEEREINKTNHIKN